MIHLLISCLLCVQRPTVPLFDCLMTTSEKGPQCPSSFRNQLFSFLLKRFVFQKHNLYMALFQNFQVYTPPSRTDAQTSRNCFCDERTNCAVLCSICWEIRC